nr:paired-like homeodomain transcription factor LEUTX isoform X4 [Oryctolagus cuniculus]
MPMGSRPGLKISAPSKENCSERASPASPASPHLSLLLRLRCHHRCCCHCRRRRRRRRRRQHAWSSARLWRKSRAPGAARRRAPRLLRTPCPQICTTSIWTPLRPGLRCLMTSGSSCACTACSMTTSQTTSRYLNPQTSRAEFCPVLEKRKRTKQSVGAPAGDLETALEGPLLCLVLYKSKCAGSLGGSLGWSEASQPGGWFSVVCGRFVMVNLDTCEVPQEDDLWGS